MAQITAKLSAISDQSCFSDISRLHYVVQFPDSQSSLQYPRHVTLRCNSSLSSATEHEVRYNNDVCVCYLSHRLQLKLVKLIKTQQTATAQTCRLKQVYKLCNKNAQSRTLNLAKSHFIRTSLTALRFKHLLHKLQQK